MGRSASRILFLLSVIGLVFFSLRPSPLVDFALDVALMPVRVLAEVVRPARLLRARSVRAADTRRRELHAADVAARRQLFIESSEYVVPEQRVLTSGRRFVHAEVIERVAGDVDRIILQVESGSCEGLEPGMPVISGEVFVGRLQAVKARRGLAIVDLVTRRDFFVGGRVEPFEPLPSGAESVRLVVGGVSTRARTADPREAGEVLLAVHNPSRTHSPEGRVVVDEGDSGNGRFRAEARGFLLGFTVAGPPLPDGPDGPDGPGAPEESEGHSLKLGLAPALDYGAGLFQVAIVCPEQVSRADEHPQADVLEDGLWRRVGATSAGDPSAWREGQKLGAGRLNGVHTGAAVASGVRLVGRVSHAGLLTADVSLLGDPGFWVPAIARLEGRREPLVLGRLVSLGRERDAAGREVILFHWDAIVPLSGAGEPVPAVLYTGSGEPLVPRGSLLGEVLLPRGPGPHLLRVEEPVDTRRLASLWVRLPVLEMEPDESAEEAP